MADKETAPLPPPAEYFNTMRVSHSEREFIFELGQIISQSQTSKSNDSEAFRLVHLIARAVTSPQHAKEVLGVLKKNLAKYEERFGEIHFPKENS